jgi:hypothetical protein
VRDAQLVFPHNRETTLAQQLIVVQQASRYGVFYRHQTNHGAVVLYVLEDILESVAAYQLYVLTLKIVVCRHIVETALDSLYCYSCHFCLYYLYKKRSRLFRSGTLYLLSLHFSAYTHNFPLHSVAKVKVKKEVIKCVQQ